MARINFLLQGLNELEDHYAALTKLLELPNISSCLISVAFMNGAGASMFTDKLAPLADRLKIFVGIRNGITSKQGLEVLMSKNICPICVDTATQAFIFHPKVYFAQNEEQAKFIIGSANLTPGGLIKNIEASLLVDLDLSLSEDIELVNKLYYNFDILQNDYPQNVLTLDLSSDLNEMVRQGILADETVQVHRINAQAQGTHERTENRPTMKTHTRKLAAVHRTRAQNVVNIGVPNTVNSITTIINNQLLWKSGPLTRRDLNIPTGPNTHATGSMLLKVGDPSQVIDQRHYFREVVFATAMWQFDLNPRFSHMERCWIKFRVIIKGVDYGIHELKLSHNSRTDTQTYLQNNSMTQIHWGETVKPMISQEDLLGGILYIYAPEELTDIYTLVFDIE